MKPIGIVGGLSWQSTATYYRLLNEGTAQALGGHHSSDLRIWSGDFDPIHQAQLRGDDPWISARLCEAAVGLVRSGAELLVIASNTCHRYAEAIEREAGKPVVHIVDATANRISQAGMSRVLLLGTELTMSGDFYSARMRDHGIECAIPEAGDREFVDRVIFDELVHGDVRAESKAGLLDIVEKGGVDGAQGVILGCTELGLILDESDGPVPGFDTTIIHCEEALARASV